MKFLKILFLSLVVALSVTTNTCGQYGWTSGYRDVLTSPAVQSSSLVFSEVSDETLKISLTRGGGRFVMITGRLTASTLANPVANTTYTASSTFGSGTQIGTGTYVLFKGQLADGEQILIDGLTENTAYTFQAFEFNQKANGTERYNHSTATGNPAAQTTLENIIAPTTQATNVTWTGALQIEWTSGNGARRIVVMREGGAVNANPTDAVTYTADIDYGEGSEIGTGNFVVYDGTDDIVLINSESLQFSTTYGVRVYEYNISAGDPLYNVTTATGNPLSHVTQADEVYYSYKETPFLTRRSPYNAYTVSREFSQLYPVGDWIGSTHHHVWFVAEGDGDNLSGIDRTIRYKRALADDPTVAANWVADGPPNSDGDTPSFIDKGTLVYSLWSSATTYSIGNKVRVIGANPSTDVVYTSLTNGNINQAPASNPDDWVEFQVWDGNQCWGPMSVVEHGGNQYGVYVANRTIAGRYGVGVIWSNDEFATYTRATNNPIIANGAATSAFYVHVHPTKVGSFWYMFMQNYAPSELVEGHLYTTQIWRTSSDPTTSGWSGWTKLTGTNDVLSGRNWYGAIDISQSWEDAGTFYAYISVNDPGETGAYNMRAEGDTQYLSTNPVGKKIFLISWTDWTTFQTSYVVERLIYKTQQQTEIDTRSWCPQRTFGGEKFFVSMDFLWKGQTSLNGNHTVEPMTDGKIISTDLNSTGATVVGTEVYPNLATKFYKPHQSHLDDVLGGTPLPKEVYADANGTVVGSPRIGRANSIQAVDNGFVTFPNFSYSQTHLQVTWVTGRNALTTPYGVVGMDTDVGGGEHGWHIRMSSQYNFEVWVYSDDNVHYKRYRVNYVPNLAGKDATQLLIIGFQFINGTLKVRIDDNLDCTVTKVVDDSFSTLNVTNEPLRIGAIYPTTNDELWARDVVGAGLIFSGSTVVNNTNWLNNNLLGY